MNITEWWCDRNLFSFYLAFTNPCVELVDALEFNAIFVLSNLY